MPIEVNTNVNNLVNIEISTTSPETPEISVEVPEAVVSVDTTVLLGPKGNGIDHISKTSAVGLVDTYTVYFTNNTTTTFNVTNGKGIVSITLTSTVGLVDTYTILFNDNSTQTFTVVNGEKGDTGDSGVYIGTTEPTDPDVKVWLNPNGTQGRVSDLIDDTSTYPIDKADTLTGLTASISELNVLDGITASTDELNFVDGVTSAIQTQLNGKQPTISDLSDIREDASDGASAYTTIQTYGDIVTHDTSEFATSVQGGLADTAIQPADLATVATTGDYDNLTNKPTIPTVNDATLTIQKNGVDVQTFTANASSNVTANITVPTDTGDLTNNVGFITSSALSGYATETWVGNQGYITQAVDDTSTTSTTLGWSASKLNSIIGDLETILASI